MQCVLCKKNSELYFSKEDPQWGHRDYLRCNHCDLIFLNPAQRISEDDEKKVYENHQNSISDEGYVEFLSQLLDPMIKKLDKNAFGIDYGCGPGPTLYKLFEKKAFKQVNFDPYFEPDSNLLNRKYDFVTCTEVFEHFGNVEHEVDKVIKLLKENGGILGVLTQSHTKIDDFETWWYHKDPTHISFYSKKTMEFIAELWELKLSVVSENVFLFKRS